MFVCACILVQRMCGSQRTSLGVVSLSYLHWSFSDKVSDKDLVLTDWAWLMEPWTPVIFLLMLKICSTCLAFSKVSFDMLLFPRLCYTIFLFISSPYQNVTIYPSFPFL